MQVSYIIVVSFYCCNDNGVVGHGEHTSSTLQFIGAFPSSFETHFGF